tara:strand:+ start:1975 stop:2940 length:966 start_codon:yes stop_codon:yes gene_type:complete
MDHAAQESDKQIILLTNSAANRGHAEAKGHLVEDMLTSLGHCVEHRLPPDIESTYKAVHDAVARGQHIIAVGGDGFIHHVVQGCAETPATVGLIPAGTGNDFVLGLDLPRELEDAVRAAVGPARPVDLLRFEQPTGEIRYGVTIATAGFSAAVNVRADNMAWPRGSSRYTLATLVELLRLQRYELQMVVDGQAVGGPCLMVAIANTRAFGGGMQIAPAAGPTTGHLDIVVIRDTSPFNLLRMLPKTFKGGHIGHPAVEIRTGQAIQLQLLCNDGSNSMNLRSDGEDVGSLPQTVTVVPGGLRVAGVSPPSTVAGEGRERTE